jgi:hypothetical protein
VKPLTSQLYRIAFTASEAFTQKLEEAKDALAAQFPDGNLENVLGAALDVLLAKERTKRGLTQNPRPARETLPTAERTIPAAVSREVWRRDGGRCQWKLASGGCCGSKRNLEYDHTVPLALGGETTASNLRLLCKFHNQRAADEAFGREKMERHRKKASPERTDERHRASG